MKQSCEQTEEVVLASKQLTAMEEKVEAFKYSLLERIPQRHSLLCGRTCGLVWKLRSGKSIGRQDLVDNVKRIQMELGTLDYHTKELSENLTQLLCQFDTIESHGEEELKSKRKALVIDVQRLLNCADKWKQKNARLRKFGEALISQTQSVLVDPSKQEKKAYEYDTMEKPTCIDGNGLDTDSKLSQNLMQFSDFLHPKSERAQGESDLQTPLDELASYSTEHTTSNSDELASLPVWKPYYQIQQRDNGIVLKTSLRGVARKNVKVECFATGMVRISGFKLPNEKELALSNFCGAPTYGRFEIVEHFMSVCSQLSAWELRSNGTLDLYIPSSSAHPWTQNQYSPSSINIQCRV
uniref:Uncharacterized protein AlNc14C227G9239 n=1 Tax=Albugo laibachii Nc14 TaxID=890382 RepID=F0WSA0_9STRA|nr:conserved hypothetical protein [Albugo laibachii Nc14]CCA26941.1 conserved hypothetical protein [Albugo laibachii Nc14]|eukprot:CCA26941.1 conserved hypothetical protein [Albugo laibachii Nc14]